MKSKLLALILICTMPLANGGIAKIPLKHPHNQAAVGYIFISQSGTGSECSSGIPCSESTAASKPAGTVVYAFDGLYSFGPVTNSVSPSGCTSTNCSGVYSFVLE